MKTIAYIAPEIPTLSATFVYNEILALQEQGYTIIPISVHLPSSPVQEERLQPLSQQTHYLYAESLFCLLMANLNMVCRSPFRYLKTLFTAFADALRVGLFNRIGIGILYRFFIASSVANTIQSKNCQHLHANFAHIPTDIGMYAAMLTDIPFSFTSHANDLFERGWLLPQKISRSSFAATISEFNKTFLASKGCDKNKIHIIRCGVQSQTFTTKSDSISSPPYCIGTLGRMVEKKGFDILIKAADLLRKKGILFKMIIAGNGPLEAELKQLVHQLNLNDFVQFPGPLPNKDVPTWLKTLDTFVLPCQQDRNNDMDGIPVVLMEAMLTGIPVISTDLSGIPELINHNTSGLLVKPKEIENLAKSIEKILFDSALQYKIKKNGIKRVCQEFDATLNIRRLKKLLDHN